MDIEMDFECRECGWVFTQSFLVMEHGRALKCPFCSCSSLSIRGESVTERQKGAEHLEPSKGGRYFMEDKIKL